MCYINDMDKALFSQNDIIHAVVHENIQCKMIVTKKLQKVETISSLSLTWGATFLDLNSLIKCVLFKKKIRFLYILSYRVIKTGNVDVTSSLVLLKPQQTKLGWGSQLESPCPSVCLSECRHKFVHISQAPGVTHFYHERIQFSSFLQVKEIKLLRINCRE